MQPLDFFRFGAGSAQADGEIIGEMIAAYRNCGSVTDDASGECHHFRGAAADIEQASAEFALVLREAGLGGRERLENRVVHAHAGAIYGGDDILRCGAGSGDDMYVRLEALANHTDRVAHIILRVERKFLRQHVQHFAVFRQLHTAGRFDGATDVIALHVAGARADGDPAAAIDATHVRAGYTDQRGFHRDADQRFGFLDGAADRADCEIEVDDLAFAPAFGFGRAQRREFHATVFIQFADQRAGFCAADVQRYDVPFLLRQIRRSSVAFAVPLMLLLRTNVLRRTFGCAVLG